jgi:transglutaminase-like putative cysteine protease
MPRLKIRHESVYTYSAPVAFGPWRLLIRPLDTHATRLISASIEAPPADIKWAYDAYGNCICHLQPYHKATMLKVVNNLVVDRFPATLAGVQTDRTVYTLADRAILEPFIAPATDDDSPRYRDWRHAQIGAAGEPALDLLQRINANINRDFTYDARYEAGTHGPDQTVALSSGTCRDFAWLMIETVRRLGFAARFVTGYLYSPNLKVRGAGATHAWCEVFLPSLGWMEFDPTNALVESADLIRVATTRTWQEADPMSGSIAGEATCNLKVAVDVDRIDETGAILAA